MTWVRRPRLALAACALLVCVACEERGPRSEVSVKYGCAIGEECITTPSEDHCLAVSVFVADADGSRRQVQVYDPDRGYAVGEGFAEFRASGLDRRFTLDIDRVLAGRDEVTLEFRYVAGATGSPVLGATVEGVTAELLANEPVSVRLYPIGRWSEPWDSRLGCAGPLRMGLEDLPPGCTPRAFHGAIPLPNGDVLIVGGVRGPRHAPRLDDRRVDANAGELAELVSVVDYYDQSAHTYVAVDIGDVDPAALTRVLFAWRYVGFTAGQHRIRLIGGAQAGATDGVLGFDVGGNAPRGVGAAPVFPDGDAVAAGTDDLILDTSGDVPRVVAVEEVPFINEPRGFMPALSEPQPAIGLEMSDASGVGFPQINGVPGGLTIGDRAYRIDPAGAALPGAYSLAHPRVGASVTPLVGATLVWGGNINDTMGVDPALDAGEIHLGGMAQRATVVGLADPTSFHRALPFGPDTVLTVGGFRVSRAPNTTYTDLPTSPMRLLQVGAEVTALPGLPSDGYTSSILHTLTDLGDGRFLVTGGGVVSPDGFSRLRASAQAGVVTFAGYEPLDDPLDLARLGHTATRLRGNRILVHGGFTSNDGGTVMNDTAEPLPELLYLVDVGAPFGGCMPVPSFPDAGAPLDAGPPSRPDAGADGGAVDAGVDAGGIPMMDAG